jgi:hypothetical protein
MQQLARFENIQTGIEQGAGRRLGRITHNGEFNVSCGDFFQGHRELAGNPAFSSND